MGQGERGDRLVRGAGLARGGTEEFPARRRIEEEGADRHGRAALAHRVGNAVEPAAGHRELGAGLAVAGERGVNRETDAIAGSASPRKPNVATPTRSAALRTLLVAWRSSASTASSRPIPLPSSLDLDERLAAVLERDAHVPCAGVERVLHQLLHHRGRSLDDLARGDLIGDGVRQDGDAAGMARI